MARHFSHLNHFRVAPGATNCTTLYRFTNLIKKVAMDRKIVGQFGMKASGQEFVLPHRYRVTSRSGENFNVYP
jgi:hypothetical protein